MTLLRTNTISRSAVRDSRRPRTGGARLGAAERLCESAPGRDRTCDLRIKSPLLYQLSYKGKMLAATTSA